MLIQNILNMLWLVCGEYAGTGMFSVSMNCAHIFSTWGDGGWIAWCHHSISIHSNTINKMHLWLLSIAYASPYYNPTTTMGHSAPSVVFSNVEEKASPKCQMATTWSFSHSSWLQSVNYSQVKTLLRTTSTQMSFPGMIFLYFGCENQLVASAVQAGWSQMILQVKKPGVEVLSWGG